MNAETTFPAQHQTEQPGKEAYMFPRPVFIRENYRGSGKLDGKTALITGGDSGIGRSVAVHFAMEGADIAIIYKPEEEIDAKETERLIETEGRNCLLLSGDLKDEAFCRQAVDNALSYFGGRINILVNNAAEQYPKEDFTEISDEQLFSTFDTNILAYFRIAREALKHMEEGDCIINTTSVTAYRGSKHLIDYASTKGAIVSFTRSLAQNLAPKNIRVNGVAPGPIWTPLIPASFDEEHVKTFGANVPLGRPGQPSEVGPAYVFLASEDASYITGQIIHPNGGEIVNT